MTQNLLTAQKGYIPNTNETKSIQFNFYSI